MTPTVTPAERAAQIAAAGGHHLVVAGADSIDHYAGIVADALPPLDGDDRLTHAVIRSAAGLDPNEVERVHHAASDVTFVQLVGGGGRSLAPGVMTLAHQGVLAISDVSEWREALFDCLRPLGRGETTVRVSRGAIAVTFPCDAQVVASAPLPPAAAARRWRQWCFQIRTVLPMVAVVDTPGTSTGWTVERVAERRSAHEAGRRVPVGADADQILTDRVRHGQITGRGYEHARRVAATIAGLDGCDEATEAHATEAAGYIATPLVDAHV